MRIARYTIGEDPAYGVVQGDGPDAVVMPLQGDPLYLGVRPAGGAPVPLDDVRLLAPVIPRSKVVGIGRNYADHARELGNEVPAEPMMFLVPNTAVGGPGDPVILPPGATEVHYEGELAVVIGRICKQVPVERVPEVIFGYTIANDVTARDWQRSDGQWFRAKGSDTFLPLGPWINTHVTIEEAGTLSIETRLNDEVRQDGSTSQMVRGIAELISFITASVTLLPGDVVLTGTPAGVGSMEPGDLVHVTIDGLGTLSNPVVDA